MKNFARVLILLFALLWVLIVVLSDTGTPPPAHFERNALPPGAGEQGEEINFTCNYTVEECAEIAGFLHRAFERYREENKK